ncbi:MULTISPECIES: SsgA family sporulation/cell division regulator [unclassified Streptomyces]|uniref:SsgA family sporulation/cell division regulator n=1 Tax=unclassified Streptomyces TaxID=2593676 RepID=UPI0036E1E1AB
MNGDRSELYSPQAPWGLPALSLPIHRILDGFVRCPMRAEFRFDPGSPMVVSVAFMADQDLGVTWRIARELLQQGLHSLSGVGDVRMRPAVLDERAMAPTSWLMLGSRDMSALFELPIPPLREWLAESYRIAPPEAETDGMDWDAFIAQVLDDSQPA